jgi:predicted phosphodiesterase
MTRLGIVSDIHGNLPALEAVLAALETQRVDRIVCCGDLVGYGPWPSEVIARLRSLDAHSVRGNHDAASASLLSTDYLNPAAAAAIAWTKTVLDPDDIAALAALPLTRDEEGMTVVHGSLRGPLWEYMHDAFVAGESFARLEGRVGLFGHTHIPGGFATDGRTMRALRPAPEVALEGTARYLLNPGSVGQPRDGDPRAAFAVFDLEADRIAFHRVAYDTEKTAREILRVGLPAPLAARLSQGR